MKLPAMPAGCLPPGCGGTAKPDGTLAAECPGALEDTGLQDSMAILQDDANRLARKYIMLPKDYIWLLVDSSCCCCAIICHRSRPRLCRIAMRDCCECCADPSIERDAMIRPIAAHHSCKIPPCRDMISTPWTPCWLVCDGCDDISWELNRGKLEEKTQQRNNKRKV